MTRRKYQPGNSSDAGGSYDLAIAGEWVQAGMYDDGLPFKALVPEQGGVTWDQAVCVSATTPNTDNAVKFVQYVTGPAFQSKLAIAKTYYSMVPNKKAAVMLPDDKRELLNLSNIENLMKFLWQIYLQGRVQIIATSGWLRGKI